MSARLRLNLRPAGRCPGEQARLVLTDEPYNVPNVGHVTWQAHHREFAMAAGEMNREEFAAFNRGWMSSAAFYVVDGGLIGTFIDWRSVELVLACGRDLGLDLINVVVWSKSNAGQGSLWRSQHELVPVFKKGAAPPLKNVELGRFGRRRSNVWCYPGASSVGSDAREGLAIHPTVKSRALMEDALLDVSARDDIVLEPFAGSGSTLIAAEATDRICPAIKIDGLYCDGIVCRWQEMTGGEAVIERAAAERYRLVSLLKQPLGGKQTERAKRKQVIWLWVAPIIHTRRPPAYPSASKPPKPPCPPAS